MVIPVGDEYRIASDRVGTWFVERKYTSDRGRGRSKTAWSIIAICPTLQRAVAFLLPRFIANERVTADLNYLLAAIERATAALVSAYEKCMNRPL